jgi:hypothetical protein
MAKQTPKMPIVPRETPTPMPIFLPVLSVAFAEFDESAAVALGIGDEEVVVEDEEVVVEDEEVVVEDEDVVVVVGTKFQPLSWIPLIVVALCTVDIVVTHAEAASFELVIVSYMTRLICCPAVMVDTHSPAPPPGKLVI